MNKPIDVLIMAFEPSGDCHGAKLIDELKKKAPGLKIAGVLGPKMRKSGAQQLLPMEKFQVMGFVDIAKNIVKLLRLFYLLRKKILKKQPKICLFIDYPEWNLLMQRSLRRSQFKGKLIQIICPSVWAWRKNRIQSMERDLDRLFVIFPFEKMLFQESRLPVHYIGNSLVADIFHYRSQHHHQKKFPLTIFPGSRKQEIIKNLPLQLLAAKKQQIIPTVSAASTTLIPLIKKTLEQVGVAAKILPPGDRYALMSQTEVAVATSGTVTLELACFQVPTIVTYATSTLDYLIATKLLKIDLPFYCLVNILLKTQAFPELFGPNFSPARLDYELNELLNCASKRATILTAIEPIKKIFNQNTDCPAEKILLEIGI